MYVALHITHGLLDIPGELVNTVKEQTKVKSNVQPEIKMDWLTYTLWVFDIHQSV